MNQYSFSIPVCISCRPISSLQLEATVKKSRYVAVSALTLASVLCGGFAVAADKPLAGMYLLLFAPHSDCNGVKRGSAALDNCGICVGGNTGRVSVCRMINDTGLTWGGSYLSGNNPGCTGEEIDAQDCSHGRDANPTYNNNADGHAGFSFTKISNSGAELPSTATQGSGANEWVCTRDNVTGLIWEVKTADGGLHDQNDSYTWYNTNSATNGGAVGYDNPGNTCEGYVSGDATTYCNTEAYTARVNTASWCGHSDWRMPTRKELQGIVSFDRVSPAIDTGYFPNTPASSVVWSGSPYAGYSDGAWLVVFDLGVSGYDNLSNGDYQVRLVRGGQ
jgi:hypothetical protein